MKILEIDILCLVQLSQTALLEIAPVPISYVDKLKLKNNFLPEILGKNLINIYALWMRKSFVDKWVPMYIGQRTCNEGWSRVKQHLFHTPSGTWSKIKEVTKFIEAGYDIGVTFINVTPDSMRLTLEDELIFHNTSSSNALPWNDKSRNVPLPGGKKQTKRKILENQARQAALRGKAVINESVEPEGRHLNCLASSTF